MMIEIFNSSGVDIEDYLYSSILYIFIAIDYCTLVGRE